MRHNAYRDGRVHVCAEMCPTCIFRPGNLMHLEAGYLRRMVDEALADGSAIVCHQTLDGDHAICRGFFERWRTQPLQIGERLGLIRWVDP